MKLFGGGPSLKEIDNIVAIRMEEIVWYPVVRGEADFGEAMTNMLDWAENYIQENNLSLWKASRVSGSIESILFSRVPGQTGSIWRKRVKDRLLIE